MNLYWIIDYNITWRVFFAKLEFLNKPIYFAQEMASSSQGMVAAAFKLADKTAGRDKICR